MLVVDKPQGPTSHDVVQWARRALGTHQVGHAGTLDPMATGVLVLAVGHATRLVPYLTADDKRYDATVRLGTTTHTLDAEGEVTRRASVPPLTKAIVARAAEAFVGRLRQRAPKVSAIKVDGKALHERERAGEQFEAPVRDVVCHALEVLEVRSPADLVGDDEEEVGEIDIRVHTGKGFYVRSLGRDLAEALGTVGHLSALRRTASGAFSADDAYRIPTGAELRVRDDDDRAEARAALLSLSSAVAGMARGEVSAEGVTEARHGRHIPGEAFLGPLPNAEVFALFGPDGALIALVRPDGDGARIVRGFPTGPENNPPAGATVTTETPGTQRRTEDA